jgi:hypothetical protein
MKDAYVIKAVGAILLISIVFGGMYVGLQQVLRQSANDPQVQIAEDTAVTLNNSLTPAILSENVDVSKSLAPFVMVFNGQYQPIDASGGVVNGTPIAPPQGVFEYAKKNGLYAFTWQPNDDLRFAAVVQPYNGGYVLAARSLREVESRSDQILMMCIIGWVLAVGVSLGTIAAVTVSRSRRGKRK